jgi:ABC-type polysaccharide/polyol phosphate export permease
VRVNAFDEQRLLTVLQRLTNRLTIGIVLAATILGAAMLMQVPTSATLFGYPALAILLFLGAALAGASLVAWIALTDRRVARLRRDKLPGQS